MNYGGTSSEMWGDGKCNISKNLDSVNIFWLLKGPPVQIWCIWTIRNPDIDIKDRIIVYYTKLVSENLESKISHMIYSLLYQLNMLKSN